MSWKIKEPKFRDWLRDFQEYARPTREVWDVIIALVGVAIPAAVYFGLVQASADVPSWVPYVAAGLTTVLYVAFVVHYRIWKAKETEIRQLKDRLTPKIEVFLDKATNSIETTRGLNGVAHYYVQIHAKSSRDSIVYDCRPHITRIEHRPTDGVGFCEVIAEPLLASWSLQPDHVVALSKGIAHRFNLFWFENTGIRHAPDISGRVPNKLLDFYQETGKRGEYRYRIHVSGREVMPTEAHITVRWRSGGYPLIEIEPISQETN